MTNMEKGLWDTLQEIVGCTYLSDLHIEEKIGTGYAGPSCRFAQKTTLPMNGGTRFTIYFPIGMG